MSVYGLLQRRGPTGFGYNSTSDEVTADLDLTGRAFLVTGGTSGLGLETVRTLAARGGRVIAAARTLAKAEAVARTLGERVVPLACELSDPGSVRAAAMTVRDREPPLSAIVANAGIMALPKREVAHGVELQLFTNHVGHFLLITELLDRLAPDGRVVMVSSAAHRGAYSGGIRFDDLDGAKEYSAWGAYGQSKLANLLFARELATRLPQSRQTANAVHPGVIATRLGRHLHPAIQAAFNTIGPALAFKSPAGGAATQTYVAVHPAAATINGEYWANCNVKPSSAHGRDRAMAKRLWEATQQIVATL